MCRRRRWSDPGDAGFLEQGIESGDRTTARACAIVLAVKVRFWTMAARVSCSSAPSRPRRVGGRARRWIAGGGPSRSSDSIAASASMARNLAARRCGACPVRCSTVRAPCPSSSSGARAACRPDRRGNPDPRHRSPTYRPPRAASLLVSREARPQGGRRGDVRASVPVERGADSAVARVLADGSAVSAIARPAVEEGGGRAGYRSVARGAHRCPSGRCLGKRLERDRDPRALGSAAPSRSADAHGRRCRGPHGG